MRTVRFLAVLVALLLPFLATSTAAAEEPGVTITGSHAAGNWVTAVVADLQGEAVFGWLVDGVSTPSTHPFEQSAPSPWPDRFFLREEHLGSEVAVQATLPTGLSVTSEPFVVEEGTIVANPPVVNGKVLIGETLTVDPKVLYPVEGVTVSYQWLGSGDGPIAGATGPTLKLTEDLRGHGIRVEVTATKSGWRDSVRRSARDYGVVVLPPAIETGSISFSRPPTAGERVAYVGWACCVPTEVETVEWLLDGKVVSRAANGELLVKEEWVGRSLVARVTRSRPFVPSVTLSTPKAIIRPPAALKSLEVRASKAVVGWTANVNWFPETPGIRKTVSWYRVDEQGNTWFPGATGGSYRITGDDVGYRVGAEVAVHGYDGEVAAVYNAVLETPIAFNLYTTPGEHTVNGRQWRTSCEKYSQTQRCRTEIIATQVVRVDGRWAQRTGWVFNNLTYLPMSTRHSWGANRLANTTEWSDDAGRQWRTDCDPRTVGYNTCRTYITAHVTQAHPLRGGGWTYETSKQWVFNNMLYHA